MDKKYRVEIEYAYYKAMIGILAQLKESQDVIDKASLDKNAVAKEELEVSRRQFKSLAQRLVAVHKKCPLRRKAAAPSQARATQR